MDHITRIIETGEFERLIGLAEDAEFEAPGGFLFVNWEKSSSRKLAS